MGCGNKHKNCPQQMISDKIDEKWKYWLERKERTEKQKAAKEAKETEIYTVHSSMYIDEQPECEISGDDYLPPHSPGRDNSANTEDVKSLQYP